MGFHNLQVLPDNSYIGLIKGRILKCNNNSNKFKTVFKIPRGSRPLNICSFPNGNLFFGEYFSNQNRSEVHIYGSFDYGETWRKVYTFPENSIRHVHGIYYDPHRKGAWVLTGDIKEECQILFTDDEFESLNTVLKGSQMVRAVSIIPMKEKVIIPTDTPLEKNFIQVFYPDTMRLNAVHQIEGSAFYCSQFDSSLVVSTVVEPSEVNKSKYAKIYISKDGEEWRELYSRHKDCWHLKYFQYSALMLPQAINRNSILYAYGQGIRRDDGCLLIFNK